jgi:hypothetical protein
LFTEGKPISADAVKALVAAKTTIEVPHLAPQTVGLRPYDGLIGEVGT